MALNPAPTLVGGRGAKPSFLEQGMRASRLVRFRLEAVARFHWLTSGFQPISDIRCRELVAPKQPVA